MKFLAIALLVFSVYLTVSHGASIPRSDDDWAKARRTCYNLLRTSAEVRERLDQKQFEDDAETHCAVRCVGIITGMYDDDTLINMENAALMAKGKNGFDEYKSAYEQCAGALPDAGDDHCKKSYDHFKCSWKAWREHVKKPE